MPYRSGETLLLCFTEMSASTDDAYLCDLVLWGGSVRVRCSEGYVIEDAVMKAVGTYAILIETPDGGGEELIFKHAVESVTRMPEE